MNEGNKRLPDEYIRQLLKDEEKAPCPHWEMRFINFKKGETVCVRCGMSGEEIEKQEAHLYKPGGIFGDPPGIPGPYAKHLKTALLAALNEHGPKAGKGFSAAEMACDMASNAFRMMGDDAINALMATTVLRMYDQAVADHEAMRRVEQSEMGKD